MTELVRNADDLPLPEPLDYCYEWDGPYGSRKFSAALHNGLPPDRSVAIYSADQLRARDAQWRAIVAAEVAKERERWEAAMKQAWSMIDPFNPAGVPGSDARGQDSGIVAALTTVRANYVAAAAIRAAAPPQCTDQPSEPQ